MKSITKTVLLWLIEQMWEFCAFYQSRLEDFRETNYFPSSIAYIDCFKGISLLIQLCLSLTCWRQIKIMKKEKLFLEKRWHQQKYNDVMFLCQITSSLVFWETLKFKKITTPLKKIYIFFDIWLKTRFQHGFKIRFGELDRFGHTEKTSVIHIPCHVTPEKQMTLGHAFNSPIFCIDVSLMNLQRGVTSKGLWLL